jgi:hypothetical protein
MSQLQPEEAGMDWNLTGIIVTALATVALAIATCALWRTTNAMKKQNEQIANFTGAMESHSTLMLRLEARKYGLPVVWWDPTQARTPGNPRHEQPADLSTIYIYLPTELRTGNKKL